MVFTQATDFWRLSWLAGPAVLLAALAAALWPAGPPEDASQPQPDSVQAGRAQAPAPAGALPLDVRAGPLEAALRQAPPRCPLQTLEVALGSQPARPACVDTTRISQTGNVRSYLAAGSGHAAWALRVEVAGGSLMRVTLRAGDGAVYACEGEACRGLQWAHQGTRGLRSLQLDAVKLVQVGSAPAAEAAVSGRLDIPSDDAFTAPACDGAAVSLHAPDGSAQRFCGQGGAGVELTDAGFYTYRFEDAEGRSLAISVDAEQRVSEVRYGPWSCRGTACSGATASSVAPGREWAERSFHFGRTPLFGGGAGPDGRALAPALFIEGSLMLPATGEP
jgi:hypothetical protein